MVGSSATRRSGVFRLTPSFQRLFRPTTVQASHPTSSWLMERMYSQRNFTSSKNSVRNNFCVKIFLGKKSPPERTRRECMTKLDDLLYFLLIFLVALIAVPGIFACLCYLSEAAKTVCKCISECKKILKN